MHVRWDLERILLEILSSENDVWKQNDGLFYLTANNNLPVPLTATYTVIKIS